MFSSQAGNVTSQMPRPIFVQGPSESGAIRAVDDAEDVD